MEEEERQQQQEQGQGQEQGQEQGQQEAEAEAARAWARVQASPRVLKALGGKGVLLKALKTAALAASIN